MEAIKDLNFLDTLLPLAVVVFVISIGVVLLNQHFRKKLLGQKLAQQTLKGLHQNELLRSSIYMQEEERKRIAQDIHDELGAILSIMRMHLVMLEQQGGLNAAKGLPAITNTRELAETALSSIRSISHRLMPPQLENFGLIKTLETITEQINHSGKMHIQLTVSPDMTEPDWDTRLGLYRITMELINNTIKHADAKNSYIEFDYHQESINCKYADDGKGFSDNGLQPGLGLKNIEARVSALKGTIAFGGNGERGFTALIKIPFKNSNLNPEH